MDDRSRWTFPEKLSFETVAEYDSQLKQLDHSGTIVFDLRKTSEIHSSFIGFLIHAKHTISRNGGTLILHLSATVERLLAMLNILEFLTSGQQPDISRKTA